MLDLTPNPYDTLRTVHEQTSTDVSFRWVLVFDKREFKWTACNLYDDDDLVNLALSPNLFAVSMILDDEIGPFVEHSKPHIVCSVLFDHATKSFPFAGNVSLSSFTNSIEALSQEEEDPS